MPGPTDANRPYPGPRLSLQHFRAMMRKYLVALAEMHATFQEKYTSLFDKGLTIQPLDCRETADALEEMYTLVQQCTSLLREDTLLPIGALAPRYRLLFASQLVQEQTRRLIDLFDSYLVQCLQPSPQAEQTRKKIQEVFRAILKYVSDIPRQALYLEEESKSMEQELIAALGEEYT